MKSGDNGSEKEIYSFSSKPERILKFDPETLKILGDLANRLNLIDYNLTKIRHHLEGVIYNEMPF